MDIEFYEFDYENISRDNLVDIFVRHGIPRVMVEIGVYAGSTALCVLNHLAPQYPNLRYIGIDPYHASVDLKDNLQDIHDFMLHRMAQCQYAKNFELIRKPSFQGLLELHNRQIQPDLIYIDGDHVAATVLSDLTLSFELLAPGGLILCDDATHWMYHDEQGRRDPSLSPRMAIETFIMCNWQKILPVKLPKDCQTAFIKLP